MGAILYLVLSNFSLLAGCENIGINLFLGGFVVIIGIAGYFVALARDRKERLVDPVSINAEA